jgi:hypothetical protein
MPVTHPAHFAAQTTVFTCGSITPSWAIASSSDKRPRSRYWQCATHLDNRKYRTSTGEESIARAKQIAEDWYLGLRGKRSAGLLKTEKTFKQAADQFTKEYGIITEGQRSERWVAGHNIRLRLHLLPFFGELASPS